MKAVEVEFWGGPADGLTTTVPSEPTSDIPAWEPYRVALDDKHKPVLDPPSPMAVPFAVAVYTRSLPRNGRWLYTFVTVERVVPPG